MDSYGATHRPSVVPSSSPQPNDQYEKSTKNQLTFQITIPFSIPSTPESAATRIIRNLEKFKLYYFEFIWLVLFIALIPRRKVSLIILAATKEAAIIYLLLMRAVPASLVLIHKILDKRLILSLLALGTGIALIATRSGLHLVITLAATMTIILAHAGLWSGWVDAVENNNVDEYTPLL
nr:PRA1 family protein F3-like [Ipomoea batatas]